MTPASDLAQRFRDDLERLTGAAPAKLGVALSAGPDSLALLLLANAAYPGRVEAATVDHRLRPESRLETELAGRVCNELGVPHSTLPVEVRSGGDGIQGEARRARYRALADWAAERGVAFLCTAHHADDQAETILMRLQRGSGVAGLSGIRPFRKEGASLTLVRPLLGWEKGELARIVHACGIAPADDPSNRDLRYDRAAIRKFLGDNPRFEPRRLARSAAALAEAEAALEWSTEEIAGKRCLVKDGEWRIDVSGLPRELKRRLLSRAIAGLRMGQEPEEGQGGARDVEGLLRALEAGGAATLAGVMARADGPDWLIRNAPPRRQR